MSAIEVEDLGVDAIGTSVAWFEARLLERGISLDSQCALQRGLRSLARRGEKARAKLTEWLTPEDALDQIAQATSADTLTKVLHWGERANLKDFRGHWRYLKSGNPLITGPSEGYSQDRTKTWELVLASLCATFCDEVHDQEPDVVSVRAQMRIGIAAKMLFTPTKKALCSRIKEGIEQIERSTVDGGIVAINLTDLYPHEQEFTAFHRMRYKYPSTPLFSVDTWVDDFVETNGPTKQEWTALFKNRTKIMAVACFLPTVVTYRNGHFPVPMPLYRWSSFYATQREAEAKEFLTQLQYAYQKARAFKE